MSIATTQSTESLSEYLTRALGKETHACVVCMETIGLKDEIWSCQVCYGVLHLSCCNRWATQCVQNTMEEFWTCPLCMSFSTQSLPLKSYCYCGQGVNPAKSHSCGRQCGKMKKCNHLCIHQCHPGPCPSCDTILEKVCGCGKVNFEVKCGDAESVAMDLSCGQKCDKLLKCGRHRCKHTCHTGACQRCYVQYEQMCFCGMTREVRGCSKYSHKVVRDPTTSLYKTFSCKRPCGKALPCGHICSRNCHPGECNKSDRHVSTSPASPTVEDEISEMLLVTSKIPGCNAKCEKIRTCGHICSYKCHPGVTNCDQLPCTTLVEIYCACGRRSCCVKCHLLQKKGKSSFVECNEACIRIQRIKETAKQLGTEVPNLPNYADELKAFAGRNMKFIKEVEKILLKLLASSISYDSYPFDPMPLWKRKFLYEYARHFNMEFYAVESDRADRIACVYKTEKSEQP